MSASAGYSAIALAHVLPCWTITNACPLKCLESRIPVAIAAMLTEHAGHCMLYAASAGQSVRIMQMLSPIQAGELRLLEPTLSVRASVQASR